MPKIIDTQAAHNLEELLEVLKEIQEHIPHVHSSVIDFTDVCAIRVTLEEETLTDGSTVYNLRIG